MIDLVILSLPFDVSPLLQALQDILDESKVFLVACSLGNAFGCLRFHNLRTLTSHQYFYSATRSYSYGVIRDEPSGENIWAVQVLYSFLASDSGGSSVRSLSSLNIAPVAEPLRVLAALREAGELLRRERWLQRDHTPHEAL